MKQVKLNIYCLFVVLLMLSTMPLMGQQKSEPNEKQLMAMANGYYVGKGVEQDYLKAYRIYRKAVVKYNNPKAMNAIGIMLQKGLGVEKNDSLAIRFWQRAAKLQYAPAMFNLGVAYKFGQGVDIDYVKALKCFSRAKQMDYPDGFYGVGYFYYKGLGVEQDYSLAVKNFEQGAKLNSASCIYFLGLCYHNGYGVEVDLEKATTLIKQAEEMGISTANQYLGSEQNTGKKSDAMTSRNNRSDTAKTTLKGKRRARFSEQEYADYTASPSLEKYNGVWTGNLLTLDWAQREILSSTNLELELSSSGDNFFAKWVEADTLVTYMEGVLTDSSIVFTSTDTIEKHSQRLVLRTAELNINSKNGNVDYLFGRFNFFDTYRKEPGRPTVLLLKRSAEQVTNSSDKENTVQPPLISILSAYPNPAGMEINVEYTLEQEQTITVEVVNALSGRRVLTYPQGIRAAGTNSALVPLNIPQGLYMLNIRNAKHDGTTMLFMKK